MNAKLGNIACFNHGASKKMLVQIPLVFLYFSTQRKTARFKNATASGKKKIHNFGLRLSKRG